MIRLCWRPRAHVWGLLLLAVLAACSPRQEAAPTLDTRLQEQGQATATSAPPSAAPAATATHTPPPTNTAVPTIAATNTPRPTATPRPETWYINATSRVNVRACASTSCEVVATADPGDEIAVLGTANDWHEIRLADGSSAYIAVFLTSREPVSTLAPAQPTAAPQQATQAPAQATQPPAPTAPPVQPTQPPPPPAPAGAACPSLGATCGQLTCDQAYACLRAGNGRLDRDNDGVPCESICPGG